MPDTVPVPRSLLRRLCLALAGIVGFMIVATVQGLFRPGYDPWHQAVSALSLGPQGWIQEMNFFVLGAFVLSAVPAWRRILAGGRASAAYPNLVIVMGLSFIAAGCVPQDPAPGYDPEGLALTAPTVTGLLHIAIAAAAAGSTIAGLFIMAARFRDDPHWRGWVAYSRIMAMLVIASVSTYAVWSTRPTGFAGTFERAAIMLPTLWTCTLIWRLWKGTPFMAGSQEQTSSPRSPG